MATSGGQTATPSGVKVKSVMHPPAGTLAPETTIRDALARMQALQISALPVVDAGGILLGIVRKDILELVPEAERSALIRMRMGSTVTATPDMDVSRVAEMMRYKGLEWVPVLEARHLVGALTLTEAETAGAPRRT